MIESDRTTARGDAGRLLEIYLDDHWAMAGAGVALARRAARNNAGTAWASKLESLADEIDADERVLTLLRAELGVDGGGWKRRLSVAGERAGRLKPNGRLVGYSPLSRVVELESLMAGVTAKRHLWATLTRVLDVAASSIDFGDLQRRAVEQEEALQALHEKSVAAAFAESSSS